MPYHVRTVGFRSALAVGLIVALAGTALAKDTKSADAIVDEMLELEPFTYGGSEARVLMVLVNKRDKQQKRKVVMMSRTDGDVQRSFIRFLSPNDVAGTAFLGISDGPDRVQHLYLPALGKTRRISSDQRNARFVGTDYSYADMDNRDLEDATRKRLDDEQISGQDCYVVDVTPRADDAEYGRVRLWIAKRSMLPLVMKMFDDKGTEKKRFVVQSAKKIDGHWVIEESKMVDLAREHTTLMRLAEIKFRKDIPLEQFTVRALERD